MRAKVQKWGNSAAVRLPVAALEAVHLKLDQAVEIEAENGVLVIRPVDAVPTYSLDEMLAGVTPENLNIDHEWEAAGPAGREGL